MSRQNPLGFIFSTIIEIAAIVAIVSFLPRFDFRSAGAGPRAAQASESLTAPVEQLISRMNWTESNNAAPVRQTSYYDQPAARPPQDPAAGSFATQQPPLTPATAANPAYVEQRLDRASQQLVNSVGTAVAQTADSFLSYRPQPYNAPQPPAAAPLTSAQRPPLPASPVAADRAFHGGSAAKVPRPWARY